MLNAACRALIAASLLALAACRPEPPPKDEPEVEAPDNDSDTDADTDTDADSDSEVQAVIVEEGPWSLAPAQVVDDVCGVGAYQDLAAFVPLEMVVEGSDAEGFRLSDGPSCARSELDFSCDEQDVSEEVLGGTAVLRIASMMSGVVLDERTLDVRMSVEILGCEGIGCGLIELALTWPCPIELSTRAERD